MNDPSLNPLPLAMDDPHLADVIFEADPEIFFHQFCGFVRAESVEVEDTINRPDSNKFLFILNDNPQYPEGSWVKLPGHPHNHPGQ